MAKGDKTAKDDNAAAAAALDKAFEYFTDCSKDVTIDCWITQPGAFGAFLFTPTGPAGAAQAKGPEQPVSFTITSAQLQQAIGGLATATLQVTPAVQNLGPATVMLRAWQGGKAHWLKGAVTDPATNTTIAIPLNKKGATVASQAVPPGRSVSYPLSFNCNQVPK
jgi:hypothetical protein